MPGSIAATGAAAAAAASAGAGAGARSALNLEGPADTKVGDEFQVVLQLSSQQGITRLRSQLRFDAAALQLISATVGDVVPAAAGGPTATCTSVRTAGGWPSRRRNRTWRALCVGLGLPDLVDTLHSWTSRRWSSRAAASVFLTRPWAADWVAELGPSGAAVVAANRGAELRGDPQLRARNTLQAVGDVMVPRNPIRTRYAEGERPSPSSALSPMTKPLADTRARPLWK